jgi:hypothetical protein
MNTLYSKTQPKPYQPYPRIDSSAPLTPAAPRHGTRHQAAGTVHRCPPARTTRRRPPNRTPCATDSSQREANDWSFAGERERAEHREGDSRGSGGAPSLGYRAHDQPPTVELGVTDKLASPGSAEVVGDCGPAQGKPMNFRHRADADEAPAASSTWSRSGWQARASALRVEEDKALFGL